VDEANYDLCARSSSSIRTQKKKRKGGPSQATGKTPAARPSKGGNSKEGSSRSPARTSSRCSGGKKGKEARTCIILIAKRRVWPAPCVLWPGGGQKKKKGKEARPTRASSSSRPPSPTGGKSTRACGPALRSPCCVGSPYFKWPRRSKREKRGKKGHTQRQRPSSRSDRTWGKGACSGRARQEFLLYDLLLDAKEMCLKRGRKKRDEDNEARHALVSDLLPGPIQRKGSD